MSNLLIIIFVLSINSIFAQDFYFINSTDSINKGIELHDSEKYNEALALYNQVERNDSNYVRSLIEKAVSLNALGEYNQVIEICKEGISYNTNYSNFF